MSDETPISHVMPGKLALRSVDDRMGELAEGQHGVVSRRQLLRLGVGRGAIEGRIASGRLRRVQWGVYAVGHRPRSRESRWMAAVLAAGPGAVLSHRSASALWRILPPKPILPEVTRATRCQARSGLVSHSGMLKPDEVRCVDGIPVTSPPRTVFDVAASSALGELERALNEMEAHGITDELSIPDLLERYPRKRGAAKLRVLLDDEAAVRGVPRKVLEERFASLLDSTDLPRPRRNADVAAGGGLFEADCLWAEQRLVVELDGRATHGTRRAFERDRERDRLLQADGWRVVRITWRQLRDDAPAVLADLRRLLRVRP
ncbi:MAG TPA: DUF559 domain-containing protein [Solirubrobacterales bacterium]|jgi:predicted transcriptional regulator of viral defense system